MHENFKYLFISWVVKAFMKLHKVTNRNKNTALAAAKLTVEQRQSGFPSIHCRV